MESRRIFARPTSSAAESASKSKFTLTGGEGRFLTSPLGILLVFPSIVLLAGVFLTLAGQRALRTTSLEMASSRLDNRATLSAEHIGIALAQADPMLDDLRREAKRRSSKDPIEPLADFMRAMMHGRKGISFVSISFDDGTFEGAFLDAGGEMFFEHSWIEGGGTTSRRYAYAPDGALLFVREAKITYDPRKRDFYQLAEASPGRVWTEPYVFEPNYSTGITRTEAIRGTKADGGAGVTSVLTVDFDVFSLSSLLGASEYVRGRRVLASDEGTILAYPRDLAEVGRVVRAERALSYRDLNDPALAALFERRQETSAAVPFHMEVSAVPYLAVRKRIPGVPFDWAVLELVPEEVFLESLKLHSKRSIVLAALAVALAVGISALFARLVVRARAAVERAQREVERANERVMELGSYRLVECLGKGGMGEVWRGEHRLLARAAAVKLIRNDTGAPPSPEALVRFRREAQSLASLRSRNTIELYDYGVSPDGTFFYVMELLDGLDLETLVVEHGRLPAGRVISILAQACRSLAEAHEAGLVHRDIKPANLFICRIADELDVVKVLDFGLVRSEATEEELASLPPPPEDEEQKRAPAESGISPGLTRSDRVMGTPDFMAPEQVLVGQVDGRTDIYALGGVAYFLLEGHAPFQGRGLMQLMVASMQEIPPRVVSTEDHPVPEALIDLVARCLEKEPVKRPATARELCEALLSIELPEKARFEEKDAREFWKGPLRSERPAVDPSILATEILLERTV